MYSITDTTADYPNKDLIEQLKELAKQKNNSVCPSCGYCTHCGCGGFRPIYPQYPTSPLPGYPYATWC